MHEFSICRALLKQVEDVARAERAHDVCVITLRLGPLSGVEPSLLRRAYLVARKETVARGAELVIEMTSLSVRCAGCGHRGAPQAGNLRCARCGSGETVLVGGNECTLTGVDIIRADCASHAEG